MTSYRSQSTNKIHQMIYLLFLKTQPIFQASILILRHYFLLTKNAHKRWKRKTQHFPSFASKKSHKENRSIWESLWVLYLRKSIYPQKLQLTRKICKPSEFEGEKQEISHSRFPLFCKQNSYKENRRESLWVLTVPKIMDLFILKSCNWQGK